MNTRTLSPDVVRLLDQRYLKPGEDWESMVSRVVSSVCSGEDVKHQMNVFDDIIDRIWLPNSPCLVNAGTTNGGLMACFVVGPTEDTLEAHVEALGDIATVGKRGGGCGFSGTFIRPEGSPVAGSAHGYAYGPNAWALRVSDYLDMITQGGFRKMALMYSLSSDHEDLDAFIDLKHTKDERFCYNFNQSIFASDAWMHNASTNGGGQESRQLAKLVHNAWGNGEPGLLFSDTINTETPYGKETCSCHIYTTNPCWSGETMVWTVYGHRRFDELAESGEDVPVLSQTSGGKFTVKMMRNPRQTGVMSVMEVELDNGHVMRCTPNHNLYLRDGTKVAASDISIGDSLSSVYRHLANSNGYLKLSNGIETPLEHHVMVEWEKGRRPDWPQEHCHHIDGNKQNNVPDNLEILPAPEHNASNMIGANNPMYGVWDERNPLFGIDVSGENNPGWRDDIDTEKLVMMRNNGMSYQKIANLVGCSKYTVMRRLGWERSQRDNHKVISVRYTGDVMPVYNGTVDDTHRYFVATGDNDGILSANCGEQPLPTYGSCNLGSINLSHQYFMDNGTFDFTNLERVARTLTRFLDSVGSRNVFPNHKFASWYNAHRPVGIGVMGYADALLKLGYAYGSSPSISFLRDVMETIYMTSYSESIKLGKERGVPEHCRGFNRRNITTVSIAPTGSIGFLAECSHGIEPVFSPVYKRTDERGDEYMFVHGMANEDHFRSSINGDKGKMPTWREHIETQAAAQEFTDSAVSKTINMFNGVTEDDVRNAMLYAWELGCKGITIYRDGSRKFQVLEDLTEEDSLLVDCPTGVCDL